MYWTVVGLLIIIAFLLFLILLEVNASKGVLVKIINRLESPTRRQ
jgi:hypothetical protein